MVAHSKILLSKCAQFRDEGQFINVRLKEREDIFPAHRIVLSANRDCFHALITDGMKESNQEIIELKDESISPDALKIVMDSSYTGDLCVNEENVFEVLAAADHLQVTNIVQQCCDFLKREFIQLRLDLHNYCLLSTVADRHGMRDLQEAAEMKMASLYVDVRESEEFLSNISADQLLSLLKCHYDENHIFQIEAILRHKHVAGTRIQTVFTVFKYLFWFQRYSSFWNMQIRQMMTSFTQPNFDQI